MAIVLNIPKEIEIQLYEDWPDISRQALEAFAAEAYRRKKVGTKQVREMLGFADRGETIEFLSEHRVYPNYDLEDYEEDKRNLAALTQQGQS